MRDADALRLARETLAHWTTIVEQLPEARAKLRDWKSEGYPAGLGESSIGGNRHSDPAAAAVVAAEITLADGKHAGFRELDAFGDRLRRMDGDLTALHKRAREIVLELGKVITEARPAAPRGCELCDDIVLPVDEHGRAQHECDETCAGRDHRHPASFQAVCSRTAPPDVDVADRVRCQFHYEFAQRYAVDAHRVITRWHLDHPGQRVPKSMVRDQHPEAFARYHGAGRTA